MLWIFALIVIVASTSLWVSYIRLTCGEKVDDSGPSIAMFAGLVALCAIGGLFNWPLWILIAVLGAIALRRLPDVGRWAAGRYSPPVR